MTLQTQPLKSNLTRKALWLFVAIFIVEALYIGLLTGFVIQTAANIEKARSARIVMQRLADFSMGSRAVLADLLQHFIENNDPTKPRPEKQKNYDAHKSLPHLVQKLQETIHDDPVAAQLVEEMDDICKHNLPQVVDELMLAEWGNPHDTHKYALLRLDSEYDELFDKMDSLEDHYSHLKQEANSELNSVSNLLVKLALGLGFSVNAAIALMLYYKFISGITRRLSKISEDIVFIASAQTPPSLKTPAKRSSDEIDLLAFEIRKMAMHVHEFRNKEKALYVNVPSIICSVDEHGVIASVSPGSAAVWGYDADELTGKRLTSMFTEDDGTIAIEKLHALFNEQVPDVDFQCDAKTKDGKRIKLAWKAKLSHGDSAVLIAHDITAESEALRSIKQSQEEFRSIVDRMPISVVTLDETFDVTSVNKATLDMFQILPADLFGRKVSALLGATAGDATAEQIASILAQSEKQPLELNAGFSRNHMLPAELNTSSYISSKSTLNYLVTFRDISVRNEIEKVKQDFVAMISHDLRSPLTALFGTLETIVEGGPEDEDSGKIEPAPLEQAKSIVSDLVNLINDFLDLEKFEAGMGVLDTSAIALETLITESVNVLPEKYARQVDVSDSVRTKVKLNVKVDKDRMQFALSNFIALVLEYSPNSARTAVSLFTDKTDATISITSAKFKLPEHVQQACLSRYEFLPSGTNAILGSSGLALALSRAVIQAHSGTVSFSNESGIESVVIQIPLTKKI